MTGTLSGRAPVRVARAITNLPAVLNPLRSEAEAFRFLLWVAVVIGTITLIVVVLRAIL
jgi:hypothetical protein